MYVHVYQAHKHGPDACNIPLPAPTITRAHAHKHTAQEKVHRPHLEPQVESVVEEQVTHFHDPGAGGWESETTDPTM